MDRFIEDFEVALSEILKSFPDVEKKAAAIRAKRSK